MTEVNEDEDTIGIQHPRRSSQMTSSSLALDPTLDPGHPSV
jgi:hypothetical protein